jgi:hypothetical protein
MRARGMKATFLCDAIDDASIAQLLDRAETRLPRRTYAGSAHRRHKRVRLD